MHYDSPIMNISTRPYYTSMSAPLSASSERFRFHVTLIAPTAMVNQANEIPVTYLNKGHVYSVLVVDMAPPMPGLTPAQYRTSIRISFEDEQQRERPAAYWQLWKEGRGTSEAPKRCGKLQAVEYVEPDQSTEVSSRNTVDLDTASLDGFSVLWTPGTGDLAACNFALRFNFLSTDFSHSKGVQGISSRLCAKTEAVSADSLHSSAEVPEICFCKVKLFRDHDAERKLSNDIAHVKKTIDKLKQQIAQVETRMTDFGKRKQSGSIAMKVTRSRGQDKVSKRKRTWSISSASHSEEDLHFELQTMQDILTSAQAVSVLYLHGEKRDDPDLHPMQLTSKPLDVAKDEPEESMTWQKRTWGCSLSITGSSSPMSPSPSPGSLQPQRIVCSGYEASAELQQSNPQHLMSPPAQPVEVQKSQQDSTGTLTRSIEALKVDSSSRPLRERPVKSVACFYILYREPDGSAKKEYYQAVYLMKRDVRELVSSIAAKCNLEPKKILHVIYVNQIGLNIEVDDDVVCELPEGQDMIVEFSRITTPHVKHEKDEAVNAILDSEEVSAVQNVTRSEGCLLKLIF